MSACIDKETVEFLLTLLDMVADVGPAGVQEICMRGNSECDIDQDKFQSQIAEARSLIEKMRCNNG